MSATDISPDDPVDTVPGVGNSRSDTLVAAGYETVEDLQLATVSELQEHVKPYVAQDIKEVVGDKTENIPTVAKAKDRAQGIPGAKAKVVKQNGKVQAKVLRKDQEQNLPGATMTVRKG